ncbi:MAG TPA: IS630 family transposase [Chloroflexota bacterium]|nr:IS630 family transposase [Chloroflexota bacterium]
MAGKSARTEPDDFHLVYLDECEVHRHPHLRRLWQRRGTVVGVPAAGEDARFIVYGALDYASGRVIWQTAPAKDSATFVAFLDQLAAALPTGRILVVLDNVGYHKSHVARRWWVAHQDRIHPLWLPAYSPELNLIERVWRHLKDKLANHRWWADLPALEHATGVLLDHLRAEFHRPDCGIRLVHNFSNAA